MQEERYGHRDGAYSAWHKRNSTGRYIGIECAQTLAMIDLDGALYVEYDDGTKEPVALVEVAVDVGQQYKNGTVTGNLALRARLPAFVVLYTLSPNPNPADTRCQDIEAFRVQMIHPRKTDWKHFTPKAWAERLVEIRKHQAKQLDAQLWPKS